jgi:PAS domain-containing protein
VVIVHLAPDRESELPAILARETAMPVVQIGDHDQKDLRPDRIYVIAPDRKLCIKRFTPQLTDIFKVKSSDRGRPIGDITHSLDYDRLEQNAQRVLADLASLERDANSLDGRAFIVRLRPYRTANDRIDGVVVTLVDVTELKRTEAVLRESEERFRALVDTSAQTVWTTDATGAVVEDSPSRRAFTGQSYPAVAGLGLARCGPPGRARRRRTGMAPRGRGQDVPGQRDPPVPCAQRWVPLDQRPSRAAVQLGRLAARLGRDEHRHRRPQAGGSRNLQQRRVRRSWQSRGACRHKRRRGHAPGTGDRRPPGTPHDPAGQRPARRHQDHPQQTHSDLRRESGSPSWSSSDGFTRSEQRSLASLRKHVTQRQTLFTA